VGGHPRDSASTVPRQPDLSDADGRWRACEPIDRPVLAEECPVVADHAVDCLWGCRGTPACLCGQGELSDDPVWVERVPGDC